MNTALEPEVMPSVPAAPDLSKLPVLNFDSMLISVTDQDSADLAIKYRNAADDYIKNVSDMLDAPTKAADRIHKFFTAMRARMTSKPTAVKLHCNAQLMAFKKQQELAAANLQAELQRRAEEQIRRKRDEEVAEAMLFGGDVAALEGAPLEVPQVTLSAPRITGINTARKPWSYKIDDLMQLLKAITEGHVSLDPDNPVVQVNGPFMTEQARYYKDKLSERFPGVSGIQEERIKR